MYRLVKRAYKELRDGEWKPSVSAFLDPEHRISVYRAALCNNNPNNVPSSESGYVCRLITEQVRSIDKVKRDNPETGETETYEVRVEATPQEHVAHADIYTYYPSAPSKRAKKNLFRLLKEALADVAEWEPGYGPADVEGE